MVGSRERSWSTLSQQLDVWYRWHARIQVVSLKIDETRIIHNVERLTGIIVLGLIEKCSCELIIRTAYYMLLDPLTPPLSHRSLHRPFDQVSNFRNFDLTARHVMPALVNVL